jgi:hypothetical protein
MTRDELYALVWSKPVTEVGLAKACRRNGVHVPPRGYWARLAVGQILERAPPPDDGDLETGVRLKGTPAPGKADVVRTMIRRRTAEPDPSVDQDSQPPADDTAAAECARILVQGLRQQLRDAAAGYLSSIAEALDVRRAHGARGRALDRRGTRGGGQRRPGSRRSGGPSRAPTGTWSHRGLARHTVGCKPIGAAGDRTSSTAASRAAGAEWCHRRSLTGIQSAIWRTTSRRTGGVHRPLAIPIAATASALPPGARL